MKLIVLNVLSNQQLGHCEGRMLIHPNEITGAHVQRGVTLLSTKQSAFHVRETPEEIAALIERASEPPMPRTVSQREADEAKIAALSKELASANLRADDGKMPDLVRRLANALEELAELGQMTKHYRGLIAEARAMVGPKETDA